MSSPFDELIALADLDIEILTLERSRASLPARVALEALAETLGELERAAELLDAERLPLARSLIELEEDVAHLATRKAQIDERLSTATGAGRDLEAMDAEARHLAERTRQLEDAELELMEALEPIEARLAARGDERQPIDVESERLVAELADEERALEEKLAARRHDRSSVSATIDGALFARYEKLGARVGGVGAARMLHGRCGGCHLELSAGELDRLNHLPADQIATCDQCDRILVRPVQLDG